MKWFQLNTCVLKINFPEKVTRGLCVVNFSGSSQSTSSWRNVSSTFCLLNPSSSNQTAITTEFLVSSRLAVAGRSDFNCWRGRQAHAIGTRRTDLVQIFRGGSLKLGTGIYNLLLSFHIILQCTRMPFLPVQFLVPACTFKCIPLN